MAYKYTNCLPNKKSSKNEFTFLTELSNFYPSIIYFEGESYSTVHHAYVAQKTIDPWCRKLVRECKTPFEARVISKGISIRDEWCDQYKIDIMEKLIFKKFENPFLQSSLFATGNEDIIEVNTFNDTFWGTYKGVGENNLGKILMKVREKLR